MKKIRTSLVFCCIFALMTSVYCASVSAMIFSDGDFGFELNTYQKVSNLVEYTGNQNIVTVPSAYLTYNLAQINKSAFYSNTNVEIVNLPTTVKKIEDEAFANCTALKTFTVSENVTAYGEGVFENCGTLSNARILSENQKLPDRTFRYCTNLSSVILGNSITEIGNSAFLGCTSLRSASFLSQISSIGEYAFYNSGLENICLSDSLQYVPDYAFANCSNLTYMSIPNTVTEISDTAFNNDSNLTLGVYYQSFAYNYAKQKSIPYVLIDGVKLGDTDGDGYVSINDVTHIQRHLAELECLEGIYLYAADVNKDGVLDISDATTLQMFLAEYEEIPYPIGEIITQ